LSLVTATEHFERIHRIISVLDEENLKIINTMKKYGPRNLQQISRKSGVPYPTVYTRVNKLAGQKLLHTYAYPNFSKIGLARALVLLTPVAGRELLVREALKLPGYWLSIIRSSGECNGYYSVHAIPADNRQDFEQYLDQLIPSGLATSYRIFWLGEYNAVASFDHFDLKKGVWKFPWASWLRLFLEERKREKPEDHDSRKDSFDKNDLLILKELTKDARKKLSEFARLIGVTLPAAKYRFDNIVRKGLIKDYIINVLPYAPVISELMEVRLDFKSESLLEAKEKLLQGLPFVMSYSKIRGANSITTRIYLPRSELNNLLTLLSTLVRHDILDRFSYLTLDPMTIENQTFSYEYYDDESGWSYDNRQYVDSLRKLVSNFEKEEFRIPSFQPGEIAPILVV